MSLSNFCYSKDESTFNIMNQNNLNILSLGSYRAIMMIYVLSTQVNNEKKTLGAWLVAMYFK